MPSEPWFWLTLSPEGTYRRADSRRSGFDHLARRLDLPIGLASIDYGSKHLGVRQRVRASGDERADLGPR